MIWVRFRYFCCLSLALLIFLKQQKIVLDEEAIYWNLSMYSVSFDIKNKIHIKERNVDAFP